MNTLKRKKEGPLKMNPINCKRIDCNRYHEKEKRCMDEWCRYAQRQIIIKLGEYCDKLEKELRMLNDNDKCEFFPKQSNEPVCDAGSDITGPFFCTKKYSLNCLWANEIREQKILDDLVYKGDKNKAHKYVPNNEKQEE